MLAWLFGKAKKKPVEPTQIISRANPIPEPPVEVWKDFSPMPREFDLVHDTKLEEASETFRPKLLLFLNELASATYTYNLINGTQWHWQIFQLRAKRKGKSLHPSGNAVDLRLVHNGKIEYIQGYEKSAFRPHQWEILDVLRCKAKQNNLEWGGLYPGDRYSPGDKQYYDPVHIENQPYKANAEPNWFVKQPSGARRQCGSS